MKSGCEKEIAAKVLTDSLLPQTLWPKVTATVPWHGVSDSEYASRLKTEIKDWEKALRLKRE